MPKCSRISRFGSVASGINSGNGRFTKLRTTRSPSNQSTLLGYDDFDRLSAVAPDGSTIGSYTYRYESSKQANQVAKILKDLLQSQAQADEVQKGDDQGKASIFSVNAGGKSFWLVRDQDSYLTIVYLDREFMSEKESWEMVQKFADTLK